MDYKQPVVTDLGDLVELTQAGIVGNTEDAGGKFVFVDVDPVAEVSAAIIP
jgi:hypothetical protein